MPYLAEFTRENRGAHATLEILGEGVGRQVATENRPFEGISSDVKDGERTIWISFGSKSQENFTHGVHGVTAIRVREATVESGPAMEIDSEDGTTTLLILGRLGEFALRQP